MTKKANDASSMGKVIAAGATVAALTAAGYILFGPDGKKNRRKINSWAIKMKGDIIEKFEEAKELTEPIFHSIVDEVAKKYGERKEVSKEEIAELVAEMKKHWKDMARDAKKAAKKSVKK
jgi:gas vesicle protein